MIGEEMGTNTASPLIDDATTEISQVTNKRINLILSENAYVDVKRLADKQGKTVSELVRLALGIARITLEEKQKGNIFIIAKPSGEAIKEIVIPW